MLRLTFSCPSDSIPESRASCVCCCLSASLLLLASSLDAEYRFGDREHDKVAYRSRERLAGSLSLTSDGVKT